MTYPNAAVADFVNANFDAIRVNIRDAQDSMRDLLRAVKPIWAPMFVFLGPRKVELRRYVGWLAPDEFIAELTFVLGMNALLRQKHEEAYEAFRQASDKNPNASVAAEALFWAGSAAYKRGGGNLDALAREWNELRQRFPDSTWARRADVLDMR